jgi:O-antigen/teichoic acid export membrane protein
MNHKQEHSDLIKNIVASARWATMLRLAAQIFSWISTIIVVRFLSPDDYGLNAMLSSPLILMLLLSTFGLESALVQTAKINHFELQSIFGWLLIINFALFTLYFFGGQLLAWYFNDPRLDLLAKVMSVIFLLVPFRVIPNALLDRDLDFKLRAQLEFYSSIVAAITTLLLAYFGAGVWALVAGVIVSRLLMIILLIIFKPWFIRPKFSITLIYKTMTVGWVITISNLFMLLSDQLVTIVAGPTIGATLLGLYVLSLDFALMPLSKGMPIVNQTMLPTFSKFQEHRDSASYYFEKLLGGISFIFIPMLVGLGCIASSLILTVVGAKWSDSIILLEILSIGMIFRLTSLQLKNIMVSMGRSGLLLKTNLLQLILLLPLTIITMQYGVIALALSWVNTELVVMLAAIQFSKSVIDISLFKLLRSYRLALISSSLMAASVIATSFVLGSHSGIFLLAAEITIGVLSYYLAARFLFKNEFRAIMKAMLGKRFAFLY